MRTPFEERQELAWAVIKFSNKMMAILVEKADEGYTGWDNELYKEDIFDSLQHHVDNENWIHVANFAMMMQGFEDEKEEEAKKTKEDLGNNKSAA